MKERKIDVYLNERLVGSMAETHDHLIAFAYSEEWMDKEDIGTLKKKY